MLFLVRFSQYTQLDYQMYIFELRGNRKFSFSLHQFCSQRFQLRIKVTTSTNVTIIVEGERHVPLGSLRQILPWLYVCLHASASLIAFLRVKIGSLYDHTFHYVIDDRTSSCMCCLPTCEYMCICAYVVLQKACNLPDHSTFTSFDFDLNFPSEGVISSSFTASKYTSHYALLQ